MQKDSYIEEIKTVELDPNQSNTVINFRNINYTILYDKNGNEIKKITVPCRYASESKIVKSIRNKDKALQLSKQLKPIDFTLLGRIIDFKFSLKARTLSHLR